MKKDDIEMLYELREKYGVTVNGVHPFNDSDFDNRVLRYNLGCFAENLLKVEDGLPFKEYRTRLKHFRKTIKKMLMEYVTSHYYSYNYAERAARKIHDDIFGNLYSTMTVYNYFGYVYVIGIIKERLTKYDYYETFKTTYSTLYKGE